MRAAEHGTDPRRFRDLMLDVAGRHLLPEPLGVGDLSRHSDQCAAALAPAPSTARLITVRANVFPAAVPNPPPTAFSGSSEGNRAAHAADEPPTLPSVSLRGK
jgi:hypothetical protein